MGATEVVVVDGYFIDLSLLTSFACKFTLDLSIYYISRRSPLFWIGVGVGLSALFSVVRTENRCHNCTLHV